MSDPSDTPGGGMFSRLKAGLAKTRELLLMNVGAIARGIGPVDANVLDQLEEALILADVGAELSGEYVDALRAAWRRGELPDTDALRARLRAMVTDTLAPRMIPLKVVPPYPFVVLVVGVNGVGKTTTIGKVASGLRAEGRTVLLAAADTFRAAAIEQLAVWAERAGADIVRHKEGADSSAVAFDAVRAAKARGIDVVLVDTAGRLHTKSHLMEEVRKVVRVIGKEIPGAPHEVLLVLDATSGRNAIAQAKTFEECTGVTGLALTKLDGTAKGGVVLSVTREIAAPIRYIGVGEKADDLRPFDAKSFAEALFWTYGRSVRTQGAAVPRGGVWSEVEAGSRERAEAQASSHGTSALPPYRLPRHLPAMGIDDGSGVEALREPESCPTFAIEPGRLTGYSTS